MAATDLALTPQAIRKHFAGDKKIHNMPDAELLRVARAAATAKALTEAYDQALKAALDELFAYVPVTSEVKA
jgi:predicted transcriptional regulator